MSSARAPVVTLGALVVDPAQGSAALSREPLNLSPAACSLLAMLVANHHRVVPRKELAAELGLHWDRSVDVLVMKVRRALGSAAVRTVRGRGWIIDAEVLGAGTNIEGRQG